MWSVSDDALVAGLAAGDSDAASAFVRRFQRRVFGLARTIVADDRAAEDVAQEAFVRAWRHAGGLRPAARERRRLAPHDHPQPRDRRGARAPAGGFDPAGADRARPRVGRPRPRTSSRSSATTPPGCALALAQLPEEQCRAIVLAGLLGYTAREVGEIEDIPLGTAKTRIRTALIRLRAALVTEERAE